MLLSGERSFSCNCPDGKTGETCEFDDLCFLEEPCINGDCVPGDGDFTCICENTGFTGDFCEEDIDECENEMICGQFGQCENKNGSYFCDCDGGWSGENCGIQDFCFENNCNFHGNCNPGDGSCVCDGGFFGETCSEIDLCFEVSCENNGQCEAGRCLCPEKYTGDSCQTVNQCYDSDVCGEGGKCIADEIGSPHCHCTEGFQVFSLINFKEKISVRKKGEEKFSNFNFRVTSAKIGSRVKRSFALRTRFVSKTLIEKFQNA